ncbi:hypothetical protein QYE76_061303 [Lolium multiflorum]|uniref:Uncharacterized protein n=1 Tax=Lolium multiflorum TaxID=4521 RepID=A0AAD8S225_LOLMU|nr:hypothetical protein QYE76_061303 [Lolium multiflorum]
MDGRALPALRSSVSGATIHRALPSDPGLAMHPAPRLLGMPHTLAADATKLRLGLRRLTLRCPVRPCVSDAQYDHVPTRILATRCLPWQRRSSSTPRGAAGVHAHRRRTTTHRFNAVKSQGVEASTEGILVGYGCVNDADVKGSDAFLRPLLAERFSGAKRHLVALGSRVDAGR